MIHYAKPVFIMLLLCVTADVVALENGLARTPPMGWYPWNEFGQDRQNEQLIKAMADAMVSNGMKDAGYLYVGPDEGRCFTRDASGNLQSRLDLWPSGMKGLGDYIHSKGLKYMLYTDAGTATCTGAIPGMRGYEGRDARQFAAWGCDYIKVDWCNSSGLSARAQYGKIRDSLLQCGRPIMYSLCCWGAEQTWTWGKSTGNLWRTTGDICGPGQANWGNVLNILDQNAPLYPYAGPGGWNDPDMLTVGMRGLNDAQNRSHFALWCIMASPLIMGCDLRTMTATTIATINNKEVIAVDQDSLGIQGKRIKGAGQLEIWLKPLKDSAYAVLLFNRTTSTRDISVTWSELGIPAGTYYIRNLWKHQDITPSATGCSATQLVAYDAAIYRISKSASVGIGRRGARSNGLENSLFSIRTQAGRPAIAIHSPGRHLVEILSINGLTINRNWFNGPGEFGRLLPAQADDICLLRVSRGSRIQTAAIPITR